MKEIPLTKGKVALVDDADWEWASQWKWCAQYSAHSKGWVARRGFYQNGRNVHVYLHRELMQAQSGQQVDHRNHDGLDNQRFNLRACSNTQNQQNSRKRANCTSQFKGVCWHKDEQNWMVQITHDGRQIHLGRFHDEKAAALAYNHAAHEYFGDFACLNPI